MSTNRRNYSEEFKLDAVKLVTEQGYRISDAASSLGVALIGMARATKGVVPRRIFAIADFLDRFVPAQHSISVCTHRFRLNTATFVQMFCTCCCPDPQTSFTS